MEITKSHRGSVKVLSLSGALIGKDCDPLEAELHECLDSENFKIVLEVEQVPFVDSEGLDKLLAIAFDLNKRGGDARVAKPNDVVKDVLKATRVDTLIQVFDDIEEAVKSLL